MYLAFMAPVSSLICVKEWRKSTNTFGLKCANVFRELISRGVSALVCTLFLVATQLYSNACQFYHTGTRTAFSEFCQLICRVSNA